MTPSLSAHAVAFAEAVAGFGPGPALILCHDDADGLSSGALIARALDRRGGAPARVRIVGRGEGAWSAAMRAELAAGPVPGGLIVADLGVEAGAILPGVATVLLDHHVPRSWPDPADATVITGYEDAPAPTTSLIAWAGAAALPGGAEGIAEGIAEDVAENLAWLAGIGLVGDLGERAAAAAFPDVLAAARRGTTAKALKEAVALVNAPRRASRGDARPALDLLLKAAGPADVIGDAHPETAVLRGARDEVKAALDRARAVAPLFAGPVALIRCDSPCQIHPLVAQSWTHRLRRQVVIAANAGFRRGYVHFAARSSSVPDLIGFLEERAPPLGADDQFAQGHRRATGGQVRVETWNRFVDGLGFAAEARV